MVTLQRMTPYDLAADLFRSGSTHDDVVARLVATGLDPTEARIAMAAAAPHPAPQPGMVDVPTPRLELTRAPPEVVPTAPPVDAPVQPGFHGWLLLATVVHAIYAAVTLLGLGVHAVAMPLLARRLSSADVGLVGLRLLLFAAAAVLLVAGMVLLARRRRAARPLLIAWNLACLAVALFSLVLGDGTLSSLVIPFAWVCYFTRSKQLRATLTN